MADVFISYKRSRRDVVERLAGALRAHGWDVWYDARLTEGEQFRKEIEAELATARCAVVLWCDQSIASDFVLDEAGWAKAQDVLIQARWMEVTPPLGFGQQQQVDILGWRQGVPALSKLIDTIERRIGPPGKPTRGPMGRPTPQAKAAAAVGAPTTLVSASFSGLPPHLAIQLEHALRETLTEQARFSLSLLEPKVRVAAEDARRAELAAINAQFRALHANELAENAARRARARERGTRTTTVQGRLGEIRMDGDGDDKIFNGYAIAATINGECNGDRYAGEFLQNRRSGVGVYHYGQNPNNKLGSLRYEGEYDDGNPNGVGVMHWRNGNRYFGFEVAGKRSGLGVYHFPNGQRYEGEYLNDLRDGSGVLWDASGSVIKAGEWSKGDLTT